jgi:hypothetical protein
LQFQSVPGRSYEIVSRETVDSGIWSIVQSVQPTQTQQTVQVDLGVTTDEPTRFYKLSVTNP